MTEWRDLPSLPDMAAALAAGDEIEYKNATLGWTGWNVNAWFADWEYRARPRKPATKIVVLRRALFRSGGDGFYPIEGTADFSTYKNFIMWLPGEETVEVPV